MHHIVSVNDRSQLVLMYGQSMIQKIMRPKLQWWKHSMFRFVIWELGLWVFCLLGYNVLGLGWVSTCYTIDLRQLLATCYTMCLTIEDLMCFSSLTGNNFMICYLYRLMWLLSDFPSNAKPKVVFEPSKCWPRFFQNS